MATYSEYEGFVRRGGNKWETSFSVYTLKAVGESVAWANATDLNFLILPGPSDAADASKYGPITY